LLSFTGLTKVLVTAGVNLGSNKIEVIDLADPTNVCHTSVLEDYPIDKLVAASGGLLSSNIGLICGGFATSMYQDRCFSFTDSSIEANVKLLQARQQAASVVINGGTTLWITGGKLSGGATTYSTELVELNGTKSGRDMPLALRIHCLVSLDDETIILIGGTNGGIASMSSATFYYNTENRTWTDGPSMITGRGGHSCALFKSAKHGRTVIVAGGMNSATQFLTSTVFLNVDNNSWTLGKFSNYSFQIEL
jgi:hypothetical protein